MTLSSSLYSPVFESAKIINTNPVILSTAEKNRILDAVGVRNTQTTVRQNYAHDTELGRSRIRKWDEKPLSTYTDPEPEIINPGQRAILIALIALGAVLTAALLWKTGKKVLGGKKHGNSH
ncbi:hypothetical protein [Methanocorpusculum vombati]|uniref:Uncharacterized protein n=1 Tax=Methanocorpusculum vombati TaxID=3002864 RepID=A0ABT4IKH8_9EURY|nr:hypothetical protein [Methanocorpusculum vombati]MCZ9319565.1 hypothetical protein [Methanocorpusculum sp.]MCZ0862255.1 hypothetical protein [Methanocorpusculum vombati]MDE2519733.1 hypothetical protein [Methanocorpusculum sp.]MDE2534485.1 hypothetical protein [Methanocorpusculum sp.]MDE2546134.1 hypothetical protein [Methanocorpusculum sp.]